MSQKHEWEIMTFCDSEPSKGFTRWRCKSCLLDIEGYGEPEEVLEEWAPDMEFEGDYRRLLVVGNEYEVEWSDCCVQGQFTSKLKASEGLGKYMPSTEWENGVTLKGAFSCRPLDKTYVLSCPGKQQEASYV